MDFRYLAEMTLSSISFITVVGQTTRISIKITPKIMCNSHHSPYKGLQHEGHDDEHKLWSRRSFLQAMGIAGSGSMMLGHNMLTASAPSPLSAGIAAAETDNILILIRLSEVNDGLSTVILIEKNESNAMHGPIFIYQKVRF